MNAIFKKLLLKTQNKTQKSIAKIVDHDFIPYVCHYNENTILTKNGELVQIIRITGFSSTSAIAELISLRDAVNKSIKDNITKNNYAVWINTLRRKKNIIPNGEFKEFLAKKIDQTWNDINTWNDQYVNELYITIIKDGLDTSIGNYQSFLRSFSYYTTKSLHKKYLEKSHNELSELVQKILDSLKDYGGKVLGIKEWDGVLYSEPMRFFGKLVNLYEHRYPLSANDISFDLSTHKLAFGDRELEVVGNSNKNFAAIFSLKEYFEVAIHSLDKILQLPFEFIISQSYDFSYTKKDLSQQENQDYILKVSGDEELRKMIGAASFVEDKTGTKTDYAKLQTTFMIISSSKEKLEKDIALSIQKFSDLGFVLIREDIFLEHCFWSQLPANFSFLTRQKAINSNKIGGFAALHSFPSGIFAGNKWGSAISVFKTVLNTPYFFNFHDGDLGHTLIIGSSKTGKSVLLNFLVAQSLRLKTKIFYFDFDNRAKCLISGLSGKYYDIFQKDNKDPSFLRLNPLSLSGKVDKRKFLAEFFNSLVIYTKNTAPEDQIQFIPQIIDRILAKNIDNFADACKEFNSIETAQIYEKLKLWNGEDLGFIFNSKNEIDWKDEIIAINLSEIRSQKAIIVPVMFYLLHRIEANFDDSPCIIVLKQPWEMLDNQVIAPYLAEFLEKAKSKNCVVLFASDDDPKIIKSEITPIIKKYLATEIYMPNADIQPYYKDVLDLKEDEIQIIKMMNPNEFLFLVKHAEDSFIAGLNLSKNVEILKILSADDLTIAAMNEVIKSISEEKPQGFSNQDWLEQLFEVLKIIEEERILEEKERKRKEFAERRRLAKEKLKSLD